MTCKQCNIWKLISCTIQACCTQKYIIYVTTHVKFCMYNILHTHLLELVGSKVKGEHPERSSQWVCYHQ